MKMSKQCSIEGCLLKYKSSGLCGSHYHRLLKWGDPLRKPNFNLKCTIQNCERKIVGMEYCNNHYRLWVRYGRPDNFDGKIREKRIKIELLFDEHFDNKEFTDECWIWNGCRNDWNYGTATYKGKKNRLVHRLSYEYFNGEIPHGMLICHHCDNPPCFNPRHLFCGTPKDNVQDCLSKGRYRNWHMIKKEQLCQLQNTR